MPGKPPRGGFRPGPPRTGGGPRPGGGRPGGGRSGRRGPYTNGASGERMAQVRRGPARPEEPVVLPAVISVGDLSERLMLSPTEVIKALIGVGVFANINQQIDYATAEKVGAALEIEVAPAEQATDAEGIVAAVDSRATEGTEARPPIVTIMGHVDHGKTKLLDAIRETKVAEGEAGGITQRIGAYQVEVQGRKISFLDTPGHEAFTAMRARGARATDIAVLVVAADDGVKPQTLEAIAHARAANVPIIVAINKIDAIGANVDRVKAQLSEAEVVPEDYGGDTPTVEVSAKEKLGIDDLLDTILLVADIAELKANPNAAASGVIIETNRDPSRGVTATVLIQNGTLNLRDSVVVGTIYGRIKAMQDDHGRKVRRALPSMPVEITGLDDVPEAGDILQTYVDDREARTVAEQRRLDRQSSSFSDVRLSLENALRNVQTGGTKELRLILKAAEQGSLGAIQNALTKLDDPSVQINIIHTGVGAIGESDVSLASASQAIIIGYNVRPDVAGKRAADSRGVDIRFYDVIYHLVDDVKAAMTGMLDPIEQETTDGYADVREIFKLPNKIVAAGLYVTDGVIRRNDRVRVLRNGAVIHDGTVTTLKRMKDDAREVQAGYECGLSLDGFNDYEVGDTLEFYRKEQIAARLA
ncbi:MAG: translation initiation factor IF-2 [Thermomicrobia bacterium]|nr:translation initiation factor IF-2 [Thermomicrobia bacterium]